MATIKKQLTFRDIEVIDALWHGKTHAQIASDWGVVKQTVSSYTARLRAKLGARNVAHLFTIALQEGLIQVYPVEPTKPLSLTPSEQTVLNLLHRGYSQVSAARKLQKKTSAVVSICTSMRMKFQVTTTSQVLGIAREQGWVTNDE